MPHVFAPYDPLVPLVTRVLGLSPAGGVDPDLTAVMAQNSPNRGPLISHNALKFGIAYAYDSSKRPF